jgi:hypothetical protein
MIKFLCDACGKDISEKVHDSVKQFCRKEHFDLDMIAEVTKDDDRLVRGLRYEINQERREDKSEVQLLEELSKLIHASAWGKSTTAMHCSNCATQNTRGEKRKIITIFTRIVDEQYAYN